MFDFEARTNTELVPLYHQNKFFKDNKQRGKSLLLCKAKYAYIQGSENVLIKKLRNFRFLLNKECSWILVLR